MTKQKSKASVEKSTYFTFLVYPDSSPADWKIQLEATGRPIAISPLHDKDLVDKKKLQEERDEKIKDLKSLIAIASADRFFDDEKHYKKLLEELQSKPLEKRFKKPHYHVIYIAKNPVTAQAVRNKIRKLLGDQSVALVKTIVTSVRNMYDYLTHESIDAIAKNKHKYDKADLTLLNNFDIERYDTLDAEEKAEKLGTLIDIIKENSLANVLDLEFFVDERGSEYNITTAELRKVIDGKSGLLRLYFDAAYQRTKRAETKLKDDREELLTALERGNELSVIAERKIRNRDKEIEKLQKQIEELQEK